MSFPKVKKKQLEELSCATPIDSYDSKTLEKVPAAMIDSKDKRFKEPKPSAAKKLFAASSSVSLMSGAVSGIPKRVTSSSAQRATSSSAQRATSSSAQRATSSSAQRATSSSAQRATSSSAQRATSSSAQRATSSSAQRATSSSASADLAKQKDLQRQVCLLVQECNDLHCLVQSKDQELQKRRLVKVFKEQSLTAHLATSEKELANHRKGNEVVKKQGFNVDRLQQLQAEITRLQQILKKKEREASDKLISEMEKKNSAISALKQARSELAELESSAKALEAKITELQRSLTCAEERLHERESAHLLLSHELETVKTEREETESMISRLQGEVQTVRLQMEQAEFVRTELEKDLSEVNDRLKVMSEEMEARNAKLAENSAKIRSLEKVVGQLNCSVVEAKNVVADKVEALQRSIEKNNEFGLKVEQQQKEISELKQLLSKSENEVYSLTLKLNNSTNMLQAKATELQGIAKETELLLKKVNEVEEINSGLEAKCSKQTIQYQKLTQAFMMLRNYCDSTVGHLSQVQAEKESLSNKLNVHQEQMTILLYNNEELRQSHQLSLESVNEEKLWLSSQVETMSETKKLLELELRTCHELLKRLETNSAKELENLRQKFDEERRQLEVKIQRQQVMQQDYRANSDRLQFCLDTNRRYSEQLTEMSHRHQQEMAELKRMLDENSQQHGDVIRIAEEAQRWRTMYDELWKKIHPLKIPSYGVGAAQSDVKRVRNELTESQGFSRECKCDRSNEVGNQCNIKVPNYGTLNIEVPSYCVGRIIGKGGMMLRHLQISSSASIKVLTGKSRPTTLVTVTGSSEAKARAEELIKEVISTCHDLRCSKHEESTPQQGISQWKDIKAPSANRSGLSDSSALRANRLAGLSDHSVQSIKRSGWSGDESEMQGKNGSGRADSWRRPSSPVRNRSQQSVSRAPDTSGSSHNRYDQDTSVSCLTDRVKEADAEFMQSKWKDFPPVRKDFYVEDWYIANLDPLEVQRIRRDNNKIMVQHLSGSDDRIPNPIRTFHEAFGHYPRIMDKLRKVGLEKPSPIQMQAWPIILKGQDLIGIAQTGTGKTLAFLLPAFIHIEGQPANRDKRGGANVLVLTPTREVALQVEEEVKKYKYKDIKCVCVYGGGNLKDQVSVVTSGVEIIVATPGRLIDLINSKVVDVKSVTYLVLDEADRMLDMGFQPDIRKILLDIRPERQTIMTSATWPVAIRHLATSYMNNPVQVYVGSMDLTACHSVLQRVVMVEDDDKHEELTSLLEREIGANDKVIVFIGRKAIVDYISTQFVLNRIDCQSIHGGRKQIEREQALEDLRSGLVRILLATDVASRGIDIKDVTHVINYDFPNNIEEYVHRVGRTGRAGRTGQSITFMTRKDSRYAHDLIQIMEAAQQEVPQELHDMAARFSASREKRKRGGGSSFRTGGNNIRDDFGGFDSDEAGERRGKKSFAFSMDGL